MLWNLREAKNKLSQVILCSQTAGPQTIAIQGKATAVLLSAEEYQKLTKNNGSLLDFFQKSPWAEVELDLSRSKEICGDII